VIEIYSNHHQTIIHYQKNKMETNKVKEVNVDNVIPFDKPKSGLSIRQENLMNETLILLNQYLTRINKFSTKELKECWGNGIYEDDNTGVFDDFTIGEEKYHELTKCYFGYNESNSKYRKRGLDFTLIHPNKEGGKHDYTLSLKKGDLRNDLSRKKISIWITKHIFSYYGTKEELDEFFFRSVFSREHNFILYS